MKRPVRYNTYAIDNVAEPFPALASTTSVPPSWVRLVRAVSTSPDKLAWGVAYIVYKQSDFKEQVTNKTFNQT